MKAFLLFFILKVRLLVFIRGQKTVHALHVGFDKLDLRGKLLINGYIKIISVSEMSDLDSNLLVRSRDRKP